MNECTFTAVPHNGQALAVMLSASNPVASGDLVAGRQWLGAFQ
jgi:hypothetical protein